MALDEAERAKLTAMLSEAEDALHRLAIGKSKVSVRSAAGHQVAYAPGDAAALRAHIAGLKQKLGLSGGGRIRMGV